MLLLHAIKRVVHCLEGQPVLAAERFQSRDGQKATGGGLHEVGPRLAAGLASGDRARLSKRGCAC